MDPLDAFMEAAVNPEVVAAEKAEAARKAQLKLEQAQALAVCAHADRLAHLAIAIDLPNTVLQSAWRTCFACCWR